MGILYATMFYFIPVTVAIMVGFKILPKSTQSRILNKIDNI